MVIGERDRALRSSWRLSFPGSLCFFLCIVVFVVSPGAFVVEGGNCTQLEPLLLETAATLYNASGVQVCIHPTLDGVVQ